MKIRRILTNNSVVILDQRGKEQIVCGKGIGFKKKAGEEIDENLIEQTFILMSDDRLRKQLEQLLADIPLEYVELAYDITKMARLTMRIKLSDSLVISLGDHLHQSVQRFRKGINISNGLRWEIRRFYEREYGIGLLALDMAEKVLSIRLPDDEAAYIAMHIVNAESDNSTMEETFRVTRLMKDITRIVRMFFGFEFDENTGYYYRFLTHLNYFARRVLKGEQYADGTNRELAGIVFGRYKMAYECAGKIEDFVADSLNYQMSDEEKMYLTIHIQMVVNKGDRKDKTEGKEA